MKNIITALILFGLSSPLIAAESSTKKKASAKEEAKEETPSGKALAAAKSLTPAQRTKLLDLINTGDDKALLSLPGIGETRAAAIKKARPFTDPVDLVKVEGIGDVTLQEIVTHAKSGFPDSDKKEAPAKATTESAAKKKAPAKSKTTTTKKKTDEAEETEEKAKKK